MTALQGKADTRDRVPTRGVTTGCDHRDLRLGPDRSDGHGGQSDEGSFTVDVRYVGNHIGKTNCGFWMATPNACGDTVKANITFNVADLFK